MADQKRRNCAALQSYFGLLDKYPEFRTNQGRIEAFTREFMNRGDAALRTTTLTIPVVVHVVYRDAAGNISKEQIDSQIDVLNQDYKAQNDDIDQVPPAFTPFVGNPNIVFALATEDPDGNETGGIIRQQTDRVSFGFDDAVKAAATGGSDPWDTKRYLNFWVCSLTGGLLGYAQFPGGPEGTDGVVITTTGFGKGGTARPPFDSGRTATHEVGHYLNLSHIWGESRFATCTDSDFVADTPNQYEPNYGTPNFPSISCNNDPNGDMFMNYMDYVDDAAMIMFSRGQVSRMQATLETSRNQLGLRPDGTHMV